MPIACILPKELRTKLKEPLGTLLGGPYAQTMARFKDILEKEKPECLISVGDIVSKNLVRIGCVPQVMILDNKAMRKPTEPVPLASERTIRVENPAATITEEAIGAIQEAFATDSTTRIVVTGEEDLLTLIAVAYAPENSFVVYGQPNEGMVIVKVTPAKKAEIACILKAMTKARKAK